MILLWDLIWLVKMLATMIHLLLLKFLKQLSIVDSQILNKYWLLLFSFFFSKCKYKWNSKYIYVCFFVFFLKKKIYDEPDLASVRRLPTFAALMKKYDANSPKPTSNYFFCLVLFWTILYQINIGAYFENKKKKNRGCLYNIAFCRYTCQSCRSWRKNIII